MRKEGPLFLNKGKLNGTQTVQNFNELFVFKVGKASSPLQQILMDKSFYRLNFKLLM